MRIERVTAYRLRIPFHSSFSHALQSRSYSEVIIVKVASDGGHIGIGEILPRPYLTGETIEHSLRDTLPTVVRRWLGKSLDTREQVLFELNAELQKAGRNLATQAGWETAILDIAGQCFGFAIGDLLGPAKRSDLAVGHVIDFDVRTCDLEKRCMLVRIKGYRYLKLKVGLPDDLGRLERIHKILPDVPLRLDANGAWSVDDALQFLSRAEPFHILSVEQPVPAQDLAGMRTIRENAGIPVVADESLCTLADAESLIRENAADVFNIRLAKCGGMLGSLRLVKLAQNAGLSCQLGTLVGETGILSRLAEIFGQRVGAFEYLEGKGQNKRLLTRDVVEMQPSCAPLRGLSLILHDSALTALQVSPPAVFE